MKLRRTQSILSFHREEPAKWWVIHQWVNHWQCILFTLYTRVQVMVHCLSRVYYFQDGSWISHCNLMRCGREKLALCECSCTSGFGFQKCNFIKLEKNILYEKLNRTKDINAVKNLQLNNYMLKSPLSFYFISFTGFMLESNGWYEYDEAGWQMSSLHWGSKPLRSHATRTWSFYENETYGILWNYSF